MQDGRGSKIPGADEASDQQWLHWGVHRHGGPDGSCHRLGYRLKVYYKKQRKCFNVNIMKQYIWSLQGHMAQISNKRERLTASSMLSWLRTHAPLRSGHQWPSLVIEITSEGGWSSVTILSHWNNIWRWLVRRRKLWQKLVWCWSIVRRLTRWWVTKTHLLKPAPLFASLFICFACLLERFPVCLFFFFFV